METIKSDVHDHPVEEIECYLAAIGCYPSSVSVTVIGVTMDERRYLASWHRYRPGGTDVLRRVVSETLDQTDPRIGQVVVYTGTRQLSDQQVADERIVEVRTVSSRTGVFLPDPVSATEQPRFFYQNTFAVGSIADRTIMNRNGAYGQGIDYAVGLDLYRRLPRPSPEQVREVQRALLQSRLSRIDQSLEAMREKIAALRIQLAEADGDLVKQSGEREAVIRSLEAVNS